MVKEVMQGLCRHPSRAVLLVCVIFVCYLMIVQYQSPEQIPRMINSLSSNKHSLPNKLVIPDPGPRQDHFVYVKIEKTGSSTFSNIFSSYGYRHSLNMMMSTIPGSLVNTREMKFGQSWDIGPDRNNPHVMEQHARYNHEFYTEHFPSQTAYITSLREPVKWFISFVDFMKVYHKHSPREVLTTTKLFYKERHFVTGMQRQVHNNFLQWLGFDVYKSEDLQAIKDYIDFVDRRFKLVIFTEYFDESLVLLRRVMNWSMADIFYKYANEATKKSGTVFTQEEKDLLLDNKHNLGDWLLYQHFNQTFWNKISQQQEFFEEVKVYRELNAKVQEFCFSDDLKRDKTKELELTTRWESNPFHFGDKDCLAIRVRDGKAEEFSNALDKYCPFRSSKSVKDLTF